MEQMSQACENEVLNIKPLSFTNGAFKKVVTHSASRALVPAAALLPATTVVVYKECLKNHAATRGGHALDGCGEFMPSQDSNPLDPASIKCAACGCHRNFHRRDTEKISTPLPPTNFLKLREQSPPPPPSPPPENFSYALLALSSAAVDDKSFRPDNAIVATPGTPTESSKKRFRTKFSREQKEKMYAFANKVGWRMQTCSDEVMENFCKEVGIRREVFKVWMHNNKNTMGRRSEVKSVQAAATATGTGDRSYDGGERNGGGSFYDSANVSSCSS